MESKKLVDIVLEELSHLNLENIKVYNTQSVTPLFDYNIVCSSMSNRQMEGIVSRIEDSSIKEGFTIRGVEGLKGGKWLLVDLNDIVVNCFYYEERHNYNIDEMYRDLLVER